MTEQSKTGVPESQGSLTEEQVQERVKEIQAAVAAFNSDPRHERYQPCTANRTVLEDYMSRNNLEWTAESLHQAFEDLSKDDKLTLYEESKLPTEPIKQAAKEDSLPPIGKATGADLGVGLADQARARQRVDGVATSSNRDAFVRAAQRFTNTKLSGGRLHL